VEVQNRFRLVILQHMLYVGILFKMFAEFLATNWNSLGWYALQILF